MTKEQKIYLGYIAAGLIIAALDPYKPFTRESWRFIGISALSFGLAVGFVSGFMKSFKKSKS